MQAKGLEGLRFTLWASLIFPCYLDISCEMAVFIKDNHILEICDILFGVTGLQVRICLESQNRLWTWDFWRVLGLLRPWELCGTESYFSMAMSLWSGTERSGGLNVNYALQLQMDEHLVFRWCCLRRVCVLWDVGPGWQKCLFRGRTLILVFISCDLL